MTAQASPTAPQKNARNKSAPGSRLRFDAKETLHYIGTPFYCFDMLSPRRDKLALCDGRENSAREQFEKHRQKGFVMQTGVQKQNAMYCYNVLSQGIFQSTASFCTKTKKECRKNEKWHLGRRPPENVSKCTKVKQSQGI